ncbi:MAG: ABC transporter ATP-binding protein [Zoogloeaceae bacterium]|nr:ABC transporter ATP-binding protein [Zoogloeaceae bacterium]
MSHEVANDRHPLPRGEGGVSQGTALRHQSRLAVQSQPWGGGRGEGSQVTEHPVLATEGLTIRFGGHVAVNNVTAEFRPGMLTAIVGPNGAGKTTYFNLISGQLPATSGSVKLYGEDITRLGAAQRTRRGIGRAFQLTNLFPNLTVLENVRLAVQSRAGLGLKLLSLWSDHVEAIERAEHFLLRVALADRRNEPASALSHGDKRKLEVAILLALEPDIFMFDEPTAGMSVDEVPVVLELIRHMKAQGDKTILLVEHKMDVVRSLADRIVVLHNGYLVADGDPAEVMNSPIVQEAYLGMGVAESV